MSKHFKIITDIEGEKRIYLSYPIQNFFYSSKEVAIVSLFSDNIQYQFPDRTIELNSRSMPTKAGNYARRELTDLVEGKIELAQFDEEATSNKKNE